MNQKIPAVVTTFGFRLLPKRIFEGGSGVKKVFRRTNVDRHFSLRKRIMAANSDIFFMGITLHKLRNFAGHLEERARSGVNVRLLVPDPFEGWLIEAIDDLLEMNGKYLSELSNFFRTFYPVWNNTREKIKIRAYSKIPTFSAMMFDGDEGNIEIYMHGWETKDRIMMELDFSNSAKDIKDNLNKIWRESKELESAEDFTTRISAANDHTHNLVSNL